MGPTSTSCCVLNCIFNENKLQDDCAHPPLPAPAFVSAEYKHLSRAPSSGWQTTKYQIKVQVAALPFLNVGVATGNHCGTLALSTQTVFLGARWSSWAVHWATPGPCGSVNAVVWAQVGWSHRPPATFAPLVIHVAQVVSGRHRWWCPGDCHPWSARGEWIFSTGFPMNHFFSCYLGMAVTWCLRYLQTYVRCPRVSFLVPLGHSRSWQVDH